MAKHFSKMYGNKALTGILTEQKFIQIADTG